MALFKKSKSMVEYFAILAGGLVTLLLVWKIFPTATEKQTISSRIISKLKAAGFSTRMATYWVAVSKFETADFQSRLFKEDNNLWGMKLAAIRPNTQAGAGGSGFAKYNSVEDSIEDIILYLKWFKYPKDFAFPDEMVGYMKMKGYFEEPYSYYLNGVKSKLS